MKSRRFIFDLDGTLLNADYSLEKDFFSSYFGDDANKITDNIPNYLEEYERTFEYYSEEILSKYLTKKVGFQVEKEIIEDWIHQICYFTDEIETGAIELIEYLKSKNYSLVVLTNWFRKTQEKRLEQSGLLEYFDEIYTGDICLKPRRESYELAISDYNYDECIMIGDNLEKDYIGPRSCSIESILYDKNDIHDKSVVKVKKLSEIKDLY